MSDTRKGISRRTFLGSSAGVMAAGFLGACDGSSSGSATDGAGGGGAIDSFTAVVPVLPDYLDPTATAFQGIANILPALEPLMLWTPDNQLKPNLAKSFKLDGNTRYIYRIRQDVKFWDGSPLTLDDVIYSFELHMGRNTQSQIAQQWNVVDTIRKTGADEITIKLKAPDPLFLPTPAETGIVNKAYHSENREQIGSPGVLNMGTGPYRYESFESQKKIVFRRNENYWGERPRVGRLETRLVTDNSTRLLALRSGDVDAVFAVPLPQVETYKGLSSVNVSSRPDPSVYKFSFDMNKEPWGSDIHLRRAFAHAVNAEGIAKGVLNGNVDVAVCGPALYLWPQHEWATKQEVTKIRQEIAAMRPEFDVEAGKRELAKSTVPDGISVTIPINRSDPSLADMVQYVAQSAKKVGIDIGIREVDDATYFNMTYFQQTTEGVSIDNSGMDRPDPSSLADIMLSSSNAKPEGSGVNTASYKNPKVDKLLAKQRQLKPSDPERGRLLVEAIKTAAPDVPYVPLNHPKIFLALRNEYTYDRFNTWFWLNRWPDDIGRNV